MAAAADPSDVRRKREPARGRGGRFDRSKRPAGGPCNCKAVNRRPSNYSLNFNTLEERGTSACQVQAFTRASSGCGCDRAMAPAAVIVAAAAPASFLCTARPLAFWICYPIQQGPAALEGCGARRQLPLSASRRDGRHDVDLPPSSRSTQPAAAAKRKLQGQPAPAAAPHRHAHQHDPDPTCNHSQ